MEKQAHYICNGGCRGVSDAPKTCGTKQCKKHKEPLTPCYCDDGAHSEYWGAGD